MKNPIFLVLTALCLGSCAENYSTDEQIDSLNKLTLTTVLGTPSLTKAAILGKELPIGSQIGVSVYKTRNESLYKGTTENLPWTGNANGWVPSNELLLSEENGMAYAYYPYNENVTDIESIPISLNETDYCWGRSLEKNLSNNLSGTSKATIYFDHALSRIALKVYKKDYAQAVLSRVLVRSAQSKAVLCIDDQKVTLNAKTGVLSGIKPEAGVSIELANEADGTFTDVILQNEIPLAATASTIVLPTDNFQNGDLEFVLTINNEDFIVPIPQPQSATAPGASGGWKSKFSYTYEIQLTGTQLVTTGASFVPWINVPIDEMEINYNSDYSYSDDKAFLFYKNQRYEKMISSDSTSVEFIAYSNKQVFPSDITAVFSKQGIGNGVLQVRSENIGEEVLEINGEKVLGDWRTKIVIGLNANLNDANARDVEVTLMARQSTISSFLVQQNGVNTHDLDALLVDIGGQKWMQFNTSGILATDVATAKEIINAGGIVDYGYASVSNWAKVSGTFFKKSSVMAGKACPSGYRVPTLAEYTALFGAAVPVRPGSVPKWLSNNPLNGSHNLPNGVLYATRRENSLGLLNVYWSFVSNNKTLYFVGAGTNGAEGSNVANELNLGLGIWTYTERTVGNVERVAPWNDGWANNATDANSAVSQVRCVKLSN